MEKLILLALIIAPLIHSVYIIKNNQKQKQIKMSQQQKKAYVITLIGMLLIILSAIIMTIMFILFAFDFQKTDTEGGGFVVGYIMMFVVVNLIFGLMNSYIPGMYLIPTVYKSKQRFSSIVYLISGIIGFATVTSIIYLITMLYYMFNKSGISDEEFDAIVNHFSPFKHISSILYIGPLLMLIGGVLSWKNLKAKNSIDQS